MSGKASWPTRRWWRRCARSPASWTRRSWSGCWAAPAPSWLGLCPSSARRPVGGRRRPRWPRRGCSSCCSGCCTASPSAARCCWWWRTCIGPTSPPATCSGSWSATCAAGVALVLTYRSDELHRRHPLRPFLAELDRSGRAERLELGRLGRRELAELLAGILDEPAAPALVGEILARSEGNPFFAEELLAAHLDGTKLPLALRDLVLARVEALSEPTQRVLEVAAVAGTRVDHELLAAVVGQDPEELVWLLREAVTRHVLAVDEASGAYVFRHALVQEAIYDDLLPVQRGPLHAAYARALERRIEQRGDVSDASQRHRRRARPARLPLVRRPRPGAGAAGQRAGRAGRGVGRGPGRGPRALRAGAGAVGPGARGGRPQPAGPRRGAVPRRRGGQPGRLRRPRGRPGPPGPRPGRRGRRAAAGRGAAGAAGPLPLDRRRHAPGDGRHRAGGGHHPRRAAVGGAGPRPGRPRPAPHAAGPPCRGAGPVRGGGRRGPAGRRAGRGGPRPHHPRHLPGRPRAPGGGHRRPGAGPPTSPGSWSTSTTWAGSTPTWPPSWTRPAVPPTPSRSSWPAPRWSARSAPWDAMAPTCSPTRPTRC